MQGTVLFLSLASISTALRCHQAVSHDLNYKPQAAETTQCRDIDVMCLKFLVSEGVPANDRGVVYGCADQQLIDKLPPGASAKDCVKTDGGKNVYCLCFGDLCNGAGIRLLGTVALLFVTLFM